MCRRRGDRAAGHGQQYGNQAERAAFLGDGAYSGGQPADLGYRTA